MSVSIRQDLEIAAPAAAHTAARPAIGGRVGRAAVRILAALVALFLLFDGGARLVGFAPYVRGTIESGYGAEQAPVIGLALLVPMVLYLIPRTAALGAVLVTGYLGGAVATNLRLTNGSPWFAFPILLGALLWLDLCLRDARVRAAFRRGS